PSPVFRTASSHFSTSFLITKTPKKFRKKRKKKDSPRTKLVQTPPNVVANFERILDRDKRFRFLTRCKDFLAKQPDRVLRLEDAGKLHQELGFPRGRKVTKSILRHPLIFQIYRHSDYSSWLGFTDFMEDLLRREDEIMNELELQRVDVVRKLLMMSADGRIPLSKIYHNRLIFGLPENFRDRIPKYPDYFKVTVEADGKRILELVDWDPSLATTCLEKQLLFDEERVKSAFKFPIKHSRKLNLEVGDEKKLNLLNTLPLVSPYSDGRKLDPWTAEAEKYRLGLVHEFLSLTLERRAYIHNMVEFKDEFSLTKRTYQMLLKQPRTFYLGGTEMNWCVFLKDAYGDEVLNEDPQVLFNRQLYEYAD
ncbi:hypothetical protein M569_14785, partial [Genlisea aurea]